jgi:hypothetical protein
MVFVIAAHGVTAGRAMAQLAPAVREAERLRTDGQLTAAVSLLQTHLASHPDDGDATRLLAQTLYWLRRIDDAQRVYVAGMQRHAADTSLRLEYGRMLVETNHRSEAHTVLEPLTIHPSTRAEALTLLGTLAYWDGDLTRARRLFTTALESAPGFADARRQLLEIDAASAPWIRLTAGARHDDQPLDRIAGGVEAGWYLTPLVPLRVRAEPMAFRLPNETVERLWMTEAGISAYLPAARLDVDAAGGAVRYQGVSDTLRWSARAGVGVRVTSTVAVRARVERGPYLNTTASLSSQVLVETARASAAWNDPRGWMAEAGIDAQRFPDDNIVRSAYAWMLVPIVRARDGEVQAGYAWGHADADDSRFELARPAQPIPPTDPGFDFSGRYVPYYTPARQVTHSVTAAAAVGPASGPRVRIAGAYGVRATELAPVLTVVDGEITRVFYERTYSPWNVRASLAIPASRRVSFGVNLDAGRTGFYRWFGGTIDLTYTFVQRVGASRS